MAAAGPFDLTPRPMWATPFFTRQWADHPAEAADILRRLYSLRDAQTANVQSGIAPRAKSAVGLYEGDFDLFADPHPGLRRLARFARDTVRECVRVVNGSEVPAGEVEVEFPDSWYHITNAGGFHDAHHHNGCSWCGIYYLRVGASGPSAGGGAPNGGTRFYSPLAVGGAYQDYGTKYLTTSVDPPVCDGLLLLFPSYLWHAALPYTGGADRVVVAFNARAYLTERAAERLAAEGGRR
jgi:uncharacterized protein (TIGR02466 family)